MNTRELKERIEQFRANPQAIQRTIVNALEAKSDGQYDLVDPSNPFVFLLEAASATGSAAMDRSEVLLRKSFPSLAREVEDLYHHMSDQDFINRFAQPAQAEFTLILSLEEIEQRLIRTDEGYDRMDIPRYSEFSIEGMEFTLLYPIEIRRMPHGGYHVVYRTEDTHPLQRLESNELDWQITKLPAAAGELSLMDIMLIRIPLYQLKFKDYYDELKQSTTFSKSYSFDGHFHYARVFLSDDGSWREINTTHSNEVYDPSTVTALLRVHEGRLYVKIPKIYFTEDMISRNIRVDIYTTQGNQERNLERYEPRAYMARWRSVDREDTRFSEPIRSFITMTLFSDDRLRGGRDALSFDRLKERVMRNTIGTREIPVTPIEIEDELEDLDFNLIKNVDHLTNRIYIASRRPSKPENLSFRSRIGTTVETYRARFNDIVEYEDVIDNGRRLTLRSKTAFEKDDDGLRLIPRETIDSARKNPINEQVNLLNNTRIFFSPFYYVIDTENNRLDVRAYDFDHPRVRTRHFVAENLTASTQISTKKYQIESDWDGFNLYLITQTGERLKEIGDEHLSLVVSYIIPDTDERVYLKAEKLGRVGENDEDIEEDEFVFKVHLQTRFDVNWEDQIFLENFRSGEFDPAAHRCDLSEEFDIIYVLEDYDSSDVEYAGFEQDYLSSFLLDSPFYALVHESVHVELGTRLNHLWQRARMIPFDDPYERYEEDVYAYHQFTIFERDPETGIIEIDYDKDNDEFSYKIKHRKGDPVLDEDGEHVLRHQKGEVKTDSYGHPVTKGVRELGFYFDLFLLEGGFLFTNHEPTIDYRESVIEQIKTWSEYEVSDINDRLLENTQLYFRAPSTIGQIPVYVEDGRRVMIDNEQSFVADVYIREGSYDDFDLRQAVEDALLDSIEENIKSRVVTTLEISNEVLSQFDDTDVLDVRLRGLGGDRLDDEFDFVALSSESLADSLESNRYNLASVDDELSELSIKKRATVLPDGRLGMVDDVRVNFIRHRQG